MDDYVSLTRMRSALELDRLMSNVDTCAQDGKSVRFTVAAKSQVSSRDKALETSNVKISSVSLEENGLREKD